MAPPGPLSRRRAFLHDWLVPSLVILAIILAVFYRVWTPIEGARRTFAWDAVWEYWGDLQFQFDAYRDGELPLWNPWDRTGYPFHADPQAGLLYPVTWLLLGVAALLGSVPYWLITIKIVFHFWLAGLGMYAFLRRRGLPKAPCYAGVVLLLLSYPYLHNEFSALNWSAAWAPWGLLAVEAWAERPGRARGAGVALVFSLSFLAGAPAGFWYVLLIVVPYGAWALLHHGRAATDRRAYARAAASSATIAAILFAAAIAAQLDATRTLVAESVREQRGLEFFGESTFSPDDLMSLFLPAFPLPNENLYLGMGAIFWAAAVLTLRPDARRLTLGGIALLGILCALGDQSIVLPLEASVLPIFGMFRRAHRYFYVTAVPVAILGAEGLALLASLEAKELRERVGRVVLAAAAVLLIICGVGFVTHLQRLDVPSPLRDAFALGFVAVLVTAWLTRQVVALDGVNRRRFVALAVLAVGLDLQLARLKTVTRNLERLPELLHDNEVRAYEGVPLGVRIYDRAYAKYRPGLRLQIRDVAGYEDDPLALARYAALRDRVRAAPSLMGHFNARWLVESGENRDKLPERQRDAAVMPRHSIHLREALVVAPAVMCGDSVNVAADALDAKRLLLEAPAGQRLVVERPDLRPDELARLTVDIPSPPPPTAGKLTRLSRNSLEAEATCPSAHGVVVVNEAWFPRGWSAWVDGQPARLFPANSAFRGVTVEGEGPHRIVMRYQADRYLALASLGILSLLGTAFWTAWGLRKREPSPTAADNAVETDQS